MTESLQTAPPEKMEYHVAGVALRLAALLYDFLLVAAVVLVVGTVLVAVGSALFSVTGESASQSVLLPAWYRYGLIGPVVFVSVYGFYALFWRKSGQTLGMQTWRLMVVTNQGRFLTYKQSLGRCAAALALPALAFVVSRVAYSEGSYALRIFFLGFLLNYVFALFHPGKRSFHDLLSGSVVLRVPKRQAGFIADVKTKLKKGGADKD